MLTTRMPRTYEPPYGTPVYWMNEVTGELPAAIKAVFAYGAEPDNQPEPTPEQLGLVIDYCRYVIYAPCWKGPGVGSLRNLAKRMTTLEELNQFIQKCLDVGIDPL
jgi:hypothetical protein